MEARLFDLMIILLFSSNYTGVHAGTRILLFFYKYICILQSFLNSNIV